MCNPAPAMVRLDDDFEATFEGGTYLGICGDTAHQARVSSHNCGANQESPITHPLTGRLVDYPDAYCNALDRGFRDRLTAANMRNRLLMGPRKLDLRYLIDHETGIGYYPDFRGGGTFSAGAGGHHLHTSAAPWSTFDTSPWLKRAMTPADRRLIERLARDAAEGRRMLSADRRPHQRGRDVKEVNVVLNRPVGNPFGHGAARDVADLQAFFGATPTGKVNRETWELVLFIYIAHGFGF